MPDTMNDLIAGYGVLFGVLFFYSVSLWVRNTRVQKEQMHLADGQKKTQPKRE